MKQTEMVTNDEHRYTLRNMFCATEALGQLQPRLDPTVSVIRVPQKMLPWAWGKEESKRFALLEIREQAGLDLLVLLKKEKEGNTSY